MKRSATAVWNGNIKEGNGNITTESSGLNETMYSVASRFEDGVLKFTTNPEELMAAAHAGCFCMKLSHLLTAAGFDPVSLQTNCVITLDPKAGVITHSQLTLKANVSNISREQFAEITKEAKLNCPVSKAYNMEIGLEAELMQGSNY